ncbi:hypothetical protein [Pseudoalteromonas rubra]|uniref:Acyltransferase 3 domain-containing protein n=1 Tax=Pseudoalteromonas rubra TaxID=43658 RepID=A0A0U3HMB1_9GAMM|nr:hypothetical protein [Pseudoalteromonas rubra]ALU42409.1 hypothetical protein AT705_05255 [Pseudoalteromonas rubra]
MVFGSQGLSLANKVGDCFGKISYSLYLLHMPVIAFVHQFDWAVEIKLLTSFLLSVAVAFVFFVCIEKPLARYIRGARYASRTNLTTVPG